MHIITPRFCVADGGSGGGSGGGGRWRMKYGQISLYLLLLGLANCNALDRFLGPSPFDYVLFLRGRGSNGS